MMLREFRNTRQVAGEPKRRWFFCHDLDLVVWEDEQGAICGFQLSYDKYRGEHCFSWRQDKGFTHYIVDDGEPLAGVNETPLLYANGPFKRDRVLEVFRALSAEMPTNIVAFVEGKFLEYPGPLPP